MSNLVRTTITIPESLLMQMRYWAIENKTNVSQLLRESVREKIGQNSKVKNKSILGLAGSLSLGGKNPPKRNKLYEKHLRQKMGA